MFYLLAFDPRQGALSWFEIFESSGEALEHRFELERDLLLQGEEVGEVVVVGASDLFSLMYNHSRYFMNHDGNNGIEWCFFCRSFLSIEDIDHEEIGALERGAFYEGHCLLCHEAYPLWFWRDKTTVVGPLPNHGLEIHSQECPVLTDIELQQT